MHLRFSIKPVVVCSARGKFIENPLLFNLQFVVTLFERKQLRQLASYPYIDMFEDLETIIESRARSVDLKVNNYYDFLYSFHVTKENYRKAAHVMYECGMRLENELCNQEGLQRQAKAYLSCINCLKLVDPKNAWIVRPVLKPKQSHHPKIGVSPKRTHEGDEIEHQQLTERKMEVLELRDIDRDFQVWPMTQVCYLFAKGLVLYCPFHQLPGLCLRPLTGFLK